MGARRDSETTRVVPYRFQPAGLFRTIRSLHVLAPRGRPCECLAAVVSRVRPTYVDDPASLGMRLRDARRGVGLTQAALAFPGCSAGYISRIEAGERVPSLQILRVLARRLGLSETFLRTGETTIAGPSVLLDAEITLRMGDIEGARSLYGQALDEAKSDSARAQALGGLGQVAAQRGETRQAIDLFEEARELVDEVSEHPHLAEALGRAYATVGELPPAIALFRECLHHFEHDPIQYIRFACLLSYALTDTGEFGEAERIVATALELGRSIVDPYARARLYWSQSRLLLERGQSELAESYALKTLKTLRVTQDMYAIGHAHQTLAHVYLDLGRAQEAAESLREGLALITAAATPLELAHYNIDRARALSALGQNREAAELATSALAELGDALPVASGRAYLLLAEIFESAGDRAQAHTLYLRAAEILEQHGPSRYLISCYKGLAGLLKAEGRMEDAVDAFERALRTQSA